MTHAAPTRVRYVVIAAATLMSVLLYLDRFCISVAEIYIQEDLGLTNEQVGWMLSAFFWTYALGQVPSGWLTDRFGSRIMLTAYVLLWSLFTGLSGAATAFGMLLLLRLGFGFAQAGAYPTAASIVSKWVPLRVRGTCSGIVSFGGRVGGFLAMYVTGFVLVWMTPADMPATLTPDDLLNGPKLCYELAGPIKASASESALSGTVLARFSTDARRMVERVAADYDPAEPGDASGSAAAAAKLSTEEARLLVENLNAVIRTRGFFRTQNIEGIAIERQAQRLLQQPPSELSDREVERLNRLVLEALYREGIKKLYVAGWRPMMFAYGALGIVVAGLIWWSCRTSPREHPACNEAEVALIESDHALKSTGAQPPSRLPLGPLLASRSMWLCCVAQWFTNVGWIFLMTWAPRYFASVHHLPVEQRAVVVAIPPLVGWLGMLSGGAITDLATQRLGLRWGRALPISFSRFLAMGAYLACLLSPDPVTAVVLFSIVAFATDIGTSATWAFSQDIGGRYVGSILGWGNMWGNLGAAVTPPLLIWIVGDGENWNYAFLTCAGAFMVSGLAALGIDASVPIGAVRKEAKR